MKLPPHLSGTPDYAPLRELFRHHIESFDHMLDHGLEAMLLNIKPVECRQAKLSYLGKLKVEVFFQYGDGVVVKEDRFNFGQFPIMLKRWLLVGEKVANNAVSHLLLTDSTVLIWIGGGTNEFHNGAYYPSRWVLIRPKSGMIFQWVLLISYLVALDFIAYKLSIMGKTTHTLLSTAETIKLLPANPLEKPMSMERNSFRDRREGYTDKAVVIRIQGKEYLLPVGVILKALADTTDHEIYVSLSCCYSETYERVKGSVGTQLVGERFYAAEAFLSYRSDFSARQPRFIAKPGSAVARYPAVQSVVPLGVPLGNQHKEKLQEWLLRVKRLLQDEINRKSNNKSSDFGIIELVKKIITDKNPPTQISLAVENMLKTGRLVTQSGLDLQQRAGMTVQAERLNFLRFISHFRAVHRGASFAGLRTTTVRKLLPEYVNSVIYTKAKKSANSLPLPLPLLADPRPPLSPLPAAVAAAPSFSHLSLAADD
ncbi:hypothetical protein RJ640_015211 [Escallonia rubra]|uniref:DNA-directed RNA polymerase n=1 Tax=Escallonia rubra TaxID=112253 RepID=A0AA88ULW2_9ASTE|nr:hypothetical protein RJ640_015211 [Escallonia rubra]